MTDRVTGIATTIVKLDRMGELQAEMSDLLQRQRDEVAALQAPIWSALNRVEEFYGLSSNCIQADLNRLDSEIRDDVIVLGVSVKGQVLHAVYSLRTTWDSKRLEGYAVAHPEVLGLRTQTPSVTLRRVNGR